MGASELRQQTYLPNDDEALTGIYEFVTTHEPDGKDQTTRRYFLGADVGERVKLPDEVYRVLRQVVEAMQSGLAVTVAPQSQRLTTQQAADLLGVSRPTVVRLLDEGAIEFERLGTHRSLLLRDVLAYRERRRAEQYAVLDALAIDPDEEGDFPAVLESLRATRRTLAARGRSGKN